MSLMEPMQRVESIGRVFQSLAGPQSYSRNIYEECMQTDPVFDEYRRGLVVSNPNKATQPNPLSINGIFNAITSKFNGGKQPLTPRGSQLRSSQMAASQFGASQIGTSQIAMTPPLANMNMSSSVQKNPWATGDTTVPSYQQPPNSMGHEGFVHPMTTNGYNSQKSPGYNTGAEGFNRHSPNMVPNPARQTVGNYGTYQKDVAQNRSSTPTRNYTRPAEVPFEDQSRFLDSDENILAQLEGTDDPFSMEYLPNSMKVAPRGYRPNNPQPTHSGFTVSGRPQTKDGPKNNLRVSQVAMNDLNAYTDCT